MDVKTVVFDNKDSGVVNIKDVSSNKVYGYIFDESKPRLLRMVDKKYKWVDMNDSTQSILTCYNKTETLAEAIKEVNSQFPNAIIYQFNNMNEFYKWAIKE